MTDDSIELTISITLKRKRPETNAGPRFDDDSITWEHEGFARWMGWRGPEAQEEEIRNQRSREQ